MTMNLLDILAYGAPELEAFCWCSCGNVWCVLFRGMKNDLVGSRETRSRRLVQRRWFSKPAVPESRLEMIADEGKVFDQGNEIKMKKVTL